MLRPGLGMLVAMFVAVAWSGAGVASASTAPSASPATTSSAPTSGDSASPLGEAELTFLTDIDNTYVTLEFWRSILDRFEAANPGVTVQIISPPSPAERDNFARQLLATGRFPDVHFNINNAIFEDALLAFDLTDPDSEQLKNKEFQLVDGKLLGIGLGIEVWSGMFYNRSMFEQAGIASAPRTWPEFETALEKLKAADFLPVVTAGEWVPSFTFMAMNDILAETPCWYDKKRAGEASFTDPEWVEASERFKGWVDKGYFGSGALGIGYTQAIETFRSGQGAIFPIGSWLSGDLNITPPEGFEVGWMPTPTRSGELKLVAYIGSTPVSVSATSESPDAAVALAKFIAFDPESLSKIMNIGGTPPTIELKEGELDLTRTPLIDQIHEAVEGAKSLGPTWYGQGGCPQVPGIDSIAIKGFAEKLLLGGDVDIPAELAALDEFWESESGQ